MVETSRKRSMFDSLFNTTDASTVEKLEEAGIDTSKKLSASPTELFDFDRHPFLFIRDKEFEALVENVREMGVLEPVIVRPRQEGGYEILAGHRRKQAALECGLKEIPIVVLDVNDDTAVKIMVATNSRRTFPVSQLAHAFRMYMDASRHQGRGDGDTETTAASIGNNFGVSERNVGNYIRLTYLLPELLEQVDAKKLQIGAAVEFSYLNEDMQQLLLEAWNETGRFPKKAQAKIIREKQVFDLSWLLTIGFAEPEKEEKLELPIRRLAQYFPEDYSEDDKKDLIVLLLQEWAARQRSVSR